MAAPVEQHRADNEQEIGGVVSFTPDGYAQLEQLAAARGQTVEDFMSDAIALIQWFDATVAHGGSIIARPAHAPMSIIRAPR